MKGFIEGVWGKFEQRGGGGNWERGYAEQKRLAVLSFSDSK